MRVLGCRAKATGLGSVRAVEPHGGPKASGLLRKRLETSAPQYQLPGVLFPSFLGCGTHWWRGWVLGSLVFPDGERTLPALQRGGLAVPGLNTSDTRGSPVNQPITEGRQGYRYGISGSAVLSKLLPHPPSLTAPDVTPHQLTGLGRRVSLHRQLRRRVRRTRFIQT